MFGSNPILPPKKSDGKNLDIQEIFATFQGEGIFTGYPSIFIRLGGCNLACEFCDTEFDSFEEKSLEEIMQKTKELSSNGEKRTHNLIVITGGEPFRQNIDPLCKKLLQDGFAVQIETNGTLFHDLPDRVDIVCSPKNPTGKYYPIRADLLPKISAFKFIISASNKDYNFVPEVGQSEFEIPVYLQPMDEYGEQKNEGNRKLVLKLAAENGCRISLQTHKFWRID
ncbi:MAG: organic radical activating enzyme [Rickettsiales bacterium]|jgi:organic radical activating enzyme